MKDRSTGGILAFLVAAPVVVICCGGYAAVLASLFGGIIGTATGLDILTTLLVAVMLGVAVLAVRTFIQSHHVGDTKDPITKDTP
ncbi:hypothetical protein [Phaeobacter piscinae]|uniref:hypothetical protein n=1 Tax=Phaeobacter piscinae TaxID=1580596 RepID=UPI000694C1F0|nr:hypothetical protein [Phaeobacter piscinae]UTS79105.1 hypothetical protein OL67_000150 [Phaeobacter piscinae]